MLPEGQAFAQRVAVTPQPHPIREVILHQIGSYSACIQPSETNREKGSQLKSTPFSDESEGSVGQREESNHQSHPMARYLEQHPNQEGAVRYFQRSENPM